MADFSKDLTCECFHVWASLLLTALGLFQCIVQWASAVRCVWPSTDFILVLLVAQVSTRWIWRDSEWQLPSCLCVCEKESARKVFLCVFIQTTLYWKIYFWNLSTCAFLFFSPPWGAEMEVGSFNRRPWASQSLRVTAKELSIVGPRGKNTAIAERFSKYILVSCLFICLSDPACSHLH